MDNNRINITGGSKPVRYDNGAQPIPYEDIIQAVKNMEYASEIRIMFEMKFLTGCRSKALDEMEYERIIGTTIYFRPGKNQKGWCSEELPQWYIEELKEYRLKHPMKKGKLFHIKSETMTHYFNRDIRPRLKGRWQEVRPIPVKGGFEYVYSLTLSGLRKSHKTLDFYKLYKEIGDASIAAELASKKFKHNTTRMTLHHYISLFNKEYLDHWCQYSAEQILMMSKSQIVLVEYL